MAWFAAMKHNRALNMGIYDGDGNALVSVEEISLAELTPEFVRERVERAAVEQFRRLLDPEAVREIFGPPEMGKPCETSIRAPCKRSTGPFNPACPPIPPAV